MRWSLRKRLAKWQGSPIRSGRRYTRGAEISPSKKLKNLEKGLDFPAVMMYNKYIERAKETNTMTTTTAMTYVVFANNYDIPTTAGYILLGITCLWAVAMVGWMVYHWNKTMR